MASQVGSPTLSKSSYLAIGGLAALCGLSFVRQRTRQRRRQTRHRERFTVNAVRVDDDAINDDPIRPDIFNNNKFAVAIAKPRKWDSLPVPPTNALVFYDAKRLYLAYITDTNTFKVPAGLLQNGAEWAEEQRMPQAMRSILNDDRMESFVWPQSPTHHPGQYFAFEVNRAGAAIVSRTRFRRQFDFGWKTAFCKHIAGAAKVPGNGGGSGSKSTSAEQVDFHVTLDEQERIAFVFSVEFSDVGLSVDKLERGDQSLRLGLYRGHRADDTGATMAWGSWVDPEDNVVDFHRKETFGFVRFVGGREK